eukprot:TRINITY_DN54491_c0_g1_i1.p1 TRINITY_DN54491_c0_g1~~TRINITY_DN54491_c0_g1_i1.p1  ORF type:complete len:497 (-),score=79.83 TRINITY_DN54491_c0_g1_i1:65-1555(-)
MTSAWEYEGLPQRSFVEGGFFRIGTKSDSDEEEPVSTGSGSQLSVKNFDGIRGPCLQIPGDSREVQLSRVRSIFDIDSPTCQVFLGCVIVSNVFIMSWETDYPEYSAFCDACEDCFTLIFAAEMAYKIADQGSIGYLAGGNSWDIFLLTCAVLDNWLVPLLVRCGVPKPNESLLIFLNLVNTLRVMRLFTMIRALLVLGAGVLHAMQAVLSVIIMIVVLIYVVAICTTRIIGHSPNSFNDTSVFEPCWNGACRRDLNVEEVMFYFGNVPRSMYTLFTVMTLTNWPIIIDSADTQYPPIMILVVFFIVMTTYTLISLLTAVITDNVISAVRNDEEQQMAAMDGERTSFLVSLKAMFNDMDDDGNGILSRDEFLAALADESLDLVGTCASLGIGCTDDQMDLSDKTLMKLFDMIALIDSGNDGSQDCSIDEFIGGFSRLCGSASAQDILTLQYEVKRLHYKVDKHAALLREIIDHLDRLGAALGEGTKGCTWETCRCS